MLSPSTFRNLVSGRRRGIVATLLRGLLRGAEEPYRWAVSYRNRRFDRGHATVHRVGVPVISVGNLTLGGTGKTPMVRWLASHLAGHGLRIALVSRGYGAADGSLNDEARELALDLPDVPHAQNRDRVLAARQVIEQHAPEVIVLDDGFQHRRLGRDLDIVLLDALEPFGFEHVFPRGTLREPLAGLARAAVVCLSRADVLPAAEREVIRHRVAQLAPRALWCELAHAPSRLINSSGATRSLAELAGRRVAAFCAIGNPAGFRHTLANTGAEIVAWNEFPDHHTFSSDELAAIGNMAAASRAEVILCTQKDLVKASKPDLQAIPLWAVAIEMQFLAGREALTSSLAESLSGRAARDEG